MILRMFQAWWARVKLMGSFRFGTSNYYYASKLHFPECASGESEERPCFKPYQCLAEFWHEYGEIQQLDYAAFLLGLSKVKQIQMNSVLDLACGTGAQSVRLAKSFPDVVGLDVSEEMLNQARTRSASMPGIQCLLQDFRHFRIGREFDAVVCASNSLNYVASLAELTEVFRCVAQHLRPNGLFVFDTFTQMGMQLISGQYCHVQTGEQRFAILFEYDWQSKTEKSTVMMPSGNEIHHRIPIDTRDVDMASQGTGFVLDSSFSTFLIPGWLYSGPVRFFVLKKT